MNATFLVRTTAVLTVVVATIIPAARADVGLIVSAANLQDENGNLECVDRVAVLVADTQGTGFPTTLQPTGALIPGSYLAPGILVLGNWDLSSLNTAGQLLNTTNCVLSGALAAGQNLALYWFPERGSADTIAGYSYSHYGIYTDSVGINGSAPWVVPSDGSVVQLNFYIASRGGSNPDTAGLAQNAGELGDCAPTCHLASVTIVPSGTNVILSFFASPLIYYNVQTSTDIVSGSWSTIATNLTFPNGEAGTITTTNFGGAITPQRFYRLLQQ
jgi:hypothetical protein